jgi:hypothetical protein
MGNSLALGLYLAWSGRGGLSYANRKLRERLKEGKEDPARVAERRGEASVSHAPTARSSGSTPRAWAKAWRFWN